MEIVVEKDCTLFELLALNYPDSSKNTLRSWLEKERVAVEGKSVKKASHLVKKGERVSVGAKAAFLDQGIKVLFEDTHLVVLYKPEGLLSVATDFDNSWSVHAILKRRFHTQRVYPVHRLDRETSGVMVFTYTESARNGLKRQFEAHSIERSYVAIVEGIVKEKSGTWQSLLAEDSNYFVRSSERGKLGITHFTVQEFGKDCTFLSFKLETGRKNQIRVHCKEAGHPIVGDKKYGSTRSAERMCLHAEKLGFVHPVTEEKLSFTAPIPQSFAAIHRKLF